MCNKALIISLNGSVLEVGDFGGETPEPDSNSIYRHNVD